jgi:hypothetical protein
VAFALDPLTEDLGRAPAHDAILDEREEPAVLV